MVNFKKIKTTAIVLALIIIAFGAGWKSSAEYQSSSLILSSSPHSLSFTDSPLFEEVYQDLQTSFLKKEELSDQKQLLYGAIKGMVSSLDDPYTVFLPPKDNQKFKEDMAGSFGGVGIKLGYKEKQLAVIAPLENTPAQKAGVQAGDLIIHIKDEEEKIDLDILNISLTEAVEIIRGKRGHAIELTLLREGEREPIKANIIRDEITIPRVTLNVIEKNNNKFAHIKLAQFGDNTIEQWKETVEKVNELKKQNNFKGIILDLRNNPGGYLDSGIYVASEFIKEGAIVKQESRQQETKTFNTDHEGSLTEEPLVVLVNRGSASASEIVAGALRERRGTKLIGETTFGKGTIQQSKDLSKNGSLHITIARWLLPSGQAIHKIGIKPDIEIKSDGNEENDPYLERAINELKNN